MTLKISTVYCSKKCANRARRLPPSLKESLIKRNTKFSMSMLNHVDRDGFIQSRQIVEFNPLNRSQKIVDKTEENRTLMAHAKLLAQARGIDPDAKKKQELKTIHAENKNLIDPEMQNFKVGEDIGFGSHDIDDEMKSLIHELKDSEIPTINNKEIEEKLEREELEKSLRTQPQQPIGLRKFGSIGGNNNNGPKK